MQHEQWNTEAQFDAEYQQALRADRAGDGAPMARLRERMASLERRGLPFFPGAGGGLSFSGRAAEIKHAERPVEARRVQHNCGCIVGLTADGELAAHHEKCARYDGAGLPMELKREHLKTGKPLPEDPSDFGQKAKLWGMP